MARKLIVAAAVIAAVAGVAHWTDLLHLVALAAAVTLGLFLVLAFSILRQQSVEPDLNGYVDDVEAGSGSTILRDGLVGLFMGGVGLVLALAIYGYVLPPFYPLLVGDCPQILPKLDIYEEAGAWSKALQMIDQRLAQPLDERCRSELVERKCRYLIAWGKTLPPDQARQKLQEAERWAAEHNLSNYRTIAQLMRDQLQPTPTPQLPPTPRPLPAGATAQLNGIDVAYFPPTVFAYLRVADGSGQPISDLVSSDLRVLDDGQPVDALSLSPFNQAPAPVCAALVIDYSGSMEGQPLEAAKAGARTFIDLLGENDQVEIIGFNDQARVLQAQTTDKQSAGQALDLLSAGNWTALWDALWLASNDLASCAGRKVIVLLTDGADNRSKHTQEEVIDQARRAGLSLFVIGLRSDDYDGATLQALVEAVGGRYAEVGEASQLEEYYRQTAGAIHNEYRLALTLKRPPDGGTHRLRIEIGGPEPLVVEQNYQDPKP